MNVTHVGDTGYVYNVKDRLPAVTVTGVMSMYNVAGQLLMKNVDCTFIQWGFILVVIIKGDIAEWNCLEIDPERNKDL